jgi:glycosyl transferase, family 25
MRNKKQNLPVFIINLKKDTGKKEYTKNLCNKYGIYPEFIEAIDGKLLNKDAIKKIYSNKKSIAEIGRKLSLSEIGCALSHKKVYGKIIDENIEAALILEDDIEFNNDLIKLMNLRNDFPIKWELILFGHHTGNSREIDTEARIWGRRHLIMDYKLVRPCEIGYGTYGYLISKTGAKKLFNYLEKIIKPIDHYTGNYFYTNLYIVNPSPIKIYKPLQESHNGMSERDKLQQAKNSLESLELISWRKKLAIYLGLYHFYRTFQKKLKKMIIKFILYK